MSKLLARVLFDYNSTSGSDITVLQDEILDIVEGNMENEWVLVRPHKNPSLIGYVPKNYIEEIRPKPPPMPPAPVAIVAAVEQAKQVASDGEEEDEKKNVQEQQTTPTTEEPVTAPIVEKPKANTNINKPEVKPVVETPSKPVEQVSTPSSNNKPVVENKEPASTPTSTNPNDPVSRVRSMWHQMEQKKPDPQPPKAVNKPLPKVYTKPLPKPAANTTTTADEPVPVPVPTITTDDSATKPQQAGDEQNGDNNDSVQTKPRGSSRIKQLQANMKHVFGGNEQPAPVAKQPITIVPPAVSTTPQSSNNTTPTTAQTPTTPASEDEAAKDEEKLKRQTLISNMQSKLSLAFGKPPVPAKVSELSAPDASPIRKISSPAIPIIKKMGSQSQLPPHLEKIEKKCVNVLRWKRFRSYYKQGPDFKDARTRKSLIQEIYTTEVTYVKALETAVNVCEQCGFTFFARYF